MRLKNVIAAAALIGLVGFTASMAQAGGSSCSGKAKATQASGSCTGMQKTGGSSCTGMSKSADMGGGCSFMAKGTGTCGSADGSMHCNMSPEQCEQAMRTYYKDHGWLGVEMICENAQTCTPKVTRVAAGSPAEAAGFKVGDILTSVNGINFDVDNAKAIQNVMDNGFKVGDMVRYTANRDGKIVSLDAKLVKVTDGALAEMIGHHVAAGHKTSDKADLSTTKATRS